MAMDRSSPRKRPVPTQGATLALVYPLDPVKAAQVRKKQAFDEFYQGCSVLLTRGNREYLLGILKEYQMYHQIDKLVSCLRSLLDTPAKLDLLKDIRRFISTSHLPVYDSLVPYHKMASPWQPALTASPIINSPKRRVRVVPHRTASRRSLSQVDYKSTRGVVPVKALSLTRGEGEDLGFSVRGGSEHGLGIFVSQIEPGSAADRAGLAEGDQILEVNNIAFSNIASTSAATVLTESLHLKMIIRELHKVPRFKSAMERTSWYDINRNLIVKGDLQSHGTDQQPPVSVDVAERHVDLTRGHLGSHRVLGFNIRGGSEYALGLYVSKVDEKGLAEQRGLRLGDEILVINRRPCKRIRHSVAVSYIENQRRLLLTVRGVGMYPVFKEIYAEYEWTDTLTRKVTRTRDRKSQAGLITEYPEESRVESYAQTDDEHSDGDFEVPISHPMDIAIQTDSDSEQPAHLLPKSSDIELRPAPSMQNGTAASRSTIEEIDKHQDQSQLRPMLAVRAMEKETRAKHPELVATEQKPGTSHSFATPYRRDQSQDAEGSSGNGRVHLKDIFFFGNKSKTKKDSSPSKSPTGKLTGTTAEHLRSHQKHKSGQQSPKKIQLASSAVEQSVREILTSDDEITAVLRHVKAYEKDKNLKKLLDPLVAILDTHQKSLLLREIRTVIVAGDLQEFDHVVVTLEQKRLYEQALRENAVNSITGRSDTKASKSQERSTESSVTTIHNAMDSSPQDSTTQPKEKYVIQRQRSSSSGHKAITDIWKTPAGSSQQSLDTPDGTSTQIGRKSVIQSSGENTQSYSGPFMEDRGSNARSKTSSDYAEIDDISSSRTKSKRVQQMPEADCLDTEIESALDTLSEVVNEESDRLLVRSDIPLYAKVNKRKTVEPDPLPDMSYINLDNTYATVDEVSEAETSRTARSQQSDTDSVVYQEAKNALQFLNDLDDGSNSDGENPWPQSTTSSTSESHFDSYNVTLHVDPPRNRLPPHDVRLAPKFIPPPPPDESPPPRLPSRGQSLESDVEESVTSVSYTQRQTSLDYSHRQKFEAVSVAMEVKSSGSAGVSKAAAPGRRPQGRREVIILSKRNKSLGFSISGGQDSRSQPEVRVKDVLPTVQAVTLQGQLKPGLILEAVDGVSLVGVSHSQAVKLICGIFNNREHPTMELQVRDMG